jgi:AP-3 complex subunit delta-1
MSSVGGMFGQKSLTDIVKGIRATKRDTGLFISACIAEIKTEISSTDPKVKATALQKLTFLQMMGYDMSFGSFATIEVMSNVRFAHKRVGYLAASQGFSQNTEVILLTTNLLKKELRGTVGGGMSGVYEAGLAVNCLSNIVTEDLARELLPDLTSLLSHPQPYIRKKAVLCMFKLFVKYPQGLRLTFSRIQQCLEDPIPSVVSCAVNVITELSDKNPKNYLPLAPSFFHLLTSSSNNWMLIKVVKLLGSLVPEEPRLARKLLDPLAEIVKTTQAKSLLYEAVYTITLCLPYCRKADGSMPSSVPAIVELCAKTLRSFVEDADQNLKYLGLVGFASLMSSHPRVLSAPDYRPLILACLSDDDITIRSRSLDLLGGMATRKNLVELVNQLLKHVDQAVGAYKSDLVEKIIEICSAEKYAHLQDFAWYLNVLVYFGHTIGIERSGEVVARQIIDVALRVLPVRVHAVQKMMEVLEGAARCRNRNVRKDIVMGASREDIVNRHESCSFVLADVLPAAAWIVGEYSSLIPAAAASAASGAKGVSVGNFQSCPYHCAIVCLICPFHSSDAPVSTQTVYVQSAMKVFASACSDTECEQNEVDACVATLETYLPVYTENPSPEVQERALSLHCLFARYGLIGKTCDQTSQMTVAGEPCDREGSESGVVGNLLRLPPDEGHNSRLDTLEAGGRCPSLPEKRDESLGLKTSSVRSTATVAVRYMLVSEPMKPVSAKAQKKKSQSQPMTLRANGEDGLASFGCILRVNSMKELTTRSDANFESVTFTQQYYSRGSARESDSFPLMDDKISKSASVSPAIAVSASSLQLQGDAGFLFEDKSPLKSTEEKARAHRLNDPFYLDVDANVGSSSGANTANQSGKFGSIRLTDSDEEAGARKKKRKEKRRKEKKGNLSTPLPMGLPTATVECSQAIMGEDTGNHFTVYRSDDDDDDDRGTMRMHRNIPSDKEFEGLSKIDLSAATAVEEKEEAAVPVILDVQARSDVMQGTQVEKASKKRGANRGRTKKKKSKKKSKDHRHKHGDTVDLLDLGGP